LQATRRKLLGKQLAGANPFAANPIRHPAERHAVRISLGGVMGKSLIHYGLFLALLVFVIFAGIRQIILSDNLDW
jgi:hypothetical protein